MSKLPKNNLGVRAAVPLALTLTILAMLGGWTAYRFGSIAKGLAYAKGERIYIDELNKSVGDIPVGQERVATFALSNLADVPITIVGARTSCGCTGVDGLPLTIPQNETRSLAVRIKAAISSGTAQVGLRLFTNDVYSPEVGIGVTAQVIPTQQAIGISR